MTRKPFHHASEAVRRQSLIDATLDCIAEYGLQGTTVRRIAENAGVTGGLIRHYFSTKELLLQTAYSTLMSTMSAAALKFAEDEGWDARSRLRNFILANFNAPIMDSRRLSLWSTFIGQTRIDPSLAEIHRISYLEFRDRLQALVGDLFADNGVQTDQNTLRNLAIALNGLLDGLWLEGSAAGNLFEDGELATIALLGAERIIGLPLGQDQSPTHT